jgi:hypothetical protein
VVRRSLVDVLVSLGIYPFTFLPKTSFSSNPQSAAHVPRYAGAITVDAKVGTQPNSVC